ncbi:cytochrome d ubiquinol oxidase subunit II [Limnochorda pilosa]|uniref:Cytochrome BD ubiquinol oxidase subunit II n=1 Tax=Limnochorda pilosa TaxID=1555112 RepID=A0A0K2SHZ6_LIMPI|nr:cytochrome d ubiquinol oxidase subunit II [Limnochorda pilosa]BAS26474.1 cytochrome BD ubiquinol oxidase subunit II [Limnochorda pilosa]
MSPAEPTALQQGVLLLMLLALNAYAVLGGADFGGGVWDLFARGPRKEAQQEAIARAMGPVWEANHVWVIFLVVLLFSAFPPVFAAVSVAFFLPLHLVLLGIILRGAAFVFRARMPRREPPYGLWASLFGAASVVTPFLLGAALGAISSGGVRLVDGAVRVDPALAWFSPLSLMIGALALTLGAYLAAVYLTVETRGALQEDFRRRALGAGAALAVIALVLLLVLPSQAPHLWQSFHRPAAWALLLGGLAAAALSAWAVWRRRFLLARAVSVAEVSILLWGWGLAHWPYLIYPDLTVAGTAVPDPTLRILLIVSLVGLVFIAPALGLLFRVFKGEPEAGPTSERPG